MKAVVRLLADPYLHVLIVAAFLLQFAIGQEGDSAQAAVGSQPRCHACGYRHAWNDICWVPRELTARRVGK